MSNDCGISVELVSNSCQNNVEMALELASGADLWCKLMSPGVKTSNVKTWSQVLERQDLERRDLEPPDLER